MNKYNIKSRHGHFMKLGCGFCSTTQKDALVFVEDEAQDVVDSFNHVYGAGYAEAVPVMDKSYAVSYVREGDLDGDGNVIANRKNPSRRRFATRDEAIQHGSRFQERKANVNDAEGSAGHIGFYVIETYDPVNAEINWKTGLTNPLGVKQ